MRNKNMIYFRKFNFVFPQLYLCTFSPQSIRKILFLISNIESWVGKCSRIDSNNQVSLVSIYILSLLLANW
jgi:hypothetical protein